MADDKRHDGSEIGKYDQKLIRQARVKGLQSDLRRLGKTEAERGKERDQRAPASKHHAGDRKKAATRHHAFNERMHLHYGQISAAKAGGKSAE